MIELQTLLHYSLHFLLPFIPAWLLFKKDWKIAWAIMLATMIVDLDHLLATPIFDPTRCSIGFHPLHSSYAIIFYFILLFVKNKYVKMIAVGLLFHMLTDLIDCLFMLYF